MSESGQKLSGVLAELPPGFELGGRYRIRRQLGRGGMGVVYEAEQLALEREVALKTLHPDLVQDARALERFQREAQAAAAIEHNGIVRVFDFASEQGITFIVMERLRGEDLRQRIRTRGAVHWLEARKIGIELADAMAAAHERGILHRDLSPANVFVARDDAGRESVKVLDFGVARLLRVASAGSQPTLGTLMYMAPERVAGRTADARSDVYAIGALLYEAIAGVPPFALCEYPELALKIAFDQPLPLATRRADCPAQLTAVVQRAMHRDLDQRWPSARALYDALSAVPAAVTASAVDQMSQTPVTATTTATPPARHSRAGGIALTGTLMAVTVTAIFALARSSTPERAPQPPKQHALDALVRPPNTVANTFVARVPETEHAHDDAPAAAVVAGATLAAEARGVRVTTQPAGATVSAPGVAPCRAPCIIDVSRAEPITLRVRSGQSFAQRRLSAPLPADVLIRLPATRPASNDTHDDELPVLLPRR